jgi:hypothetical protein
MKHLAVRLVLNIFEGVATFLVYLASAARIIPK